VWGAVLVMALAAMADPLRIGITVLIVSRPRPVLQSLAFCSAPWPWVSLSAWVCCFFCATSRWTS
jgi:hypothetical protein